MASEQGSETGTKADSSLSIDTARAERSQATANDEGLSSDEIGNRTRGSVGSERHPSQIWLDMSGQQEGPVGNPPSLKKPRRRLTESDTRRQSSMTGNVSVQRQPPPPPPQDGATKSDPAHRASKPSTSSSENGRGNINDDDDGSTWSWSPRRRPSSRVRPRTLGPRSWIVACTRINDRVANNLAQLCTLKGQADDLLRLSSQIMPSARRRGNWAFAFSKPESSAGAEAGEKEGFDSVYDESLERLTAEPDILVAELRALQKALGTTLPASRRISADLGNLTSASGSVSSGGGSSRPTGTDVDLEALSRRWTALSERVASLSSHLDKIVEVTAEACRKSGRHPERPRLVARLKELVAEAQQGIMSAEYEDATLNRVLEQVYAEDRSGPGSPQAAARGSWGRTQWYLYRRL
ncbi:hypothetical protein PG999_011131 [Apiospora kogelbergensis]|uniref:Uncharacterized protein n=1 Tax=Apiospora kogelbergensis TaxID=1337665 RepID=A0AAW0QDF2_9PEZI